MRGWKVQRITDRKLDLPSTRPPRRSPTQPIISASTVRESWAIREWFFAIFVRRWSKRGGLVDYTEESRPDTRPHISSPTHHQCFHGQKNIFISKKLEKSVFHPIQLWNSKIICNSNPYIYRESGHLASEIRFCWVEAEPCKPNIYIRWTLAPTHKILDNLIMINNLFLDSLFSKNAEYSNGGSCEGCGLILAYANLD